ncbi:MAG TPA: bifunctional tetrahydrofolate synthase/dihydrofolate synthase [Xanthomonadaceae bacterium]
MNLDEWLVHQQRQHPDAIALGLDRVHVVASRLGLRRPAAHVITVAGTNGKGSTVAFLEAIARAQGLHVGAYTSPHLLRYNERVRIDGVDASDEALIAAFERIEAARLAEHGAPIPLTYFEYGTLAALLLFEQAQLDLAILEVGLGGRLDAVNIVDADVAVITTVDLDHQEFLGADREAIGLEKAGIMRAGKPVVLGESDPPAGVLRHAYRIGASAIRAGCDFLVEDVDGGWRWREPGYALDLPEPALAAPAQRGNAAAAIAALRALDIGIADAAIIAGVRSARVRARLQSFVRDGMEIVVDVAHNPQAARMLAAWLAAHPPAGRTLAVFSALTDKDLTGIVAPVASHIARWWLCGLRDTPRGLDGDALAGRLQATLADATTVVCTDVAQALHAARAEAREGDRVLVFGSFHTAADALRALSEG